MDCGFRIIEIPLDSPGALQSVAYLAAAIGDEAIVGAGTVVRELEVDQLKLVGCELCVSPHTDVDLIRRAKSAGMITVAGVFTPTESFAAIDAGVDVLKLFPAELAGPVGVRALRTVLPAGVPIFPVGGIKVSNMDAYLGAGALGCRAVAAPCPPSFERPWSAERLERHHSRTLTHSYSSIAPPTGAVC